MATSNTKPKAASQPPVHEVDGHGRHRIVTFRSGIPERSEWFQPYEIAVFRDLRASTQDRGGIPQGIFRVTPVKHEVL